MNRKTKLSMIKLKLIQCERLGWELLHSVQFLVRYSSKIVCVSTVDNEDIQIMELTQLRSSSRASSSADITSPSLISIHTPRHIDGIMNYLRKRDEVNLLKALKYELPIDTNFTSYSFRHINNQSVSNHTLLVFIPILHLHGTCLIC